MKRSFFLPIFLAIFLTVFIAPSKADDLLDVQNQINQKNSDLAATQANLNQIKKNIAALGNSLNGTQAQLDQANEQITQIRQQLDDANTALEKKRETLAYLISIRNDQIRSIYQYPQRTPLELFLTNGDLTGFTENLSYQTQVVTDSRRLITLVNNEVSSMEQTRNQIQDSKNQLEALATQISAKLAALKNDYNSANSNKYYLSNRLVTIQSSLKGLTDKQNQLIAARLAQFAQNQTLGSGMPASVTLPIPSFSPAYALAAYGYPHRVGMSQFGAFGRSVAGQDYQTILHAYFSNVSIGSYPEPDTINVAGYGNMSFEDNYLLGISEMPRSWPLSALEAQAVAARTYAIKWLQSNPGGAICTTQSCQVFNPGQVNQSDRWYQAVQATRGIVITYNGSPINAWYSSTDGGYTLSSQAVWGGATPYALGIRDVAPGGSWPTDSYDGPKYTASSSYPNYMFHKAWGTANSCSGAYNPWMTKDQVADLFNSILLSDKDSSYTSQLNPPDGCFGPAGISFQAVKNALAAKGVADVGDIGNIVTGFDNQGNTATLNVVSSNYGLIVFDGNKFRSMVLLRSPGSISLPTTLFDFMICPPTCS